MACEKPVIISDIPWYHGKFKNNQHLTVVPPRNVESLAIEIERSLLGKTKLNLKEAARKVHCNMNLSKENKKLEELYEKLLNVQTHK